MKLEKFSSRKAPVKRPLWSSQEVARHLDLTVRELHRQLHARGGPKPLHDDGKHLRFDIAAVIKWWKSKPEEVDGPREPYVPLRMRSRKPSIARRQSPREEAISRGEKTYVTGKLCKNGHLAPRTTSTSDCLECIAERYAKKKVAAA